MKNSVEGCRKVEEDEDTDVELELAATAAAVGE